MVKLATSSAVSLIPRDMDSGRQSKKMKKRRDLDKLLAVNGRGPLVSKRRRIGEGSSSEDAESANLR